MVLYHGARHGHIESIVAAGLIPGGIGGGRKRRDTYITTQDPWSLKNPIAQLRGGARVVVVVDASKRINADVKCWTHPPGTILTRENIPPYCLISIKTIEGAQLWANIAADTPYDMLKPKV